MTVAERRERDRAHRRQAIITAARQMAEAEGWDAVTTRRLADQIEYSQPVLYSHFPGGKGGIIDAVAVEGFAELHLSLRDARQAAGSPEAALAELAGRLGPAEGQVGAEGEHGVVEGRVLQGEADISLGEFS